MDGMLSLFQSVSDGKNEYIPIFLKAFDDHQCFQKSSTARVEFISHLTGLLSTTSTRYEGLLLLEQTLKQCSLDILEQKGSLWAGLCIKTCSQKNIFTCVPMACRALGMLIEKSVEIPELSKAFTNHLLGNFFDSLKNSPESGARDVLDCVQISLRVYPGACGPHRGAIEKFVGTFVDCCNRDVVRSAAKCLHLLQQIRGGNTVGTSYQETWQKLQLSLVGSLHETFDNIFADCPEVHDYVDHLEKWNFPVLQLSDNPIVRASQLLGRFKNLITYLLTVLTEPFPVPKLIMPRKILNLIQRGLAVNCKTLQKSPSANNLAVGALLPDIHVELFSLLDALVLTLTTNMAIYVHTFLSCVMETLKWTNSGKSTGFTKSFGSLRIAAYNSLSLWNETLKYGSCSELIAEYIIEQIKNDITPFQNEVTLKVLSGGKKHMSKKARRLLHKAQNEQSNISQTHSKAFNPQNTKIVYSDEGNQHLCAAALNCLKSIIQTAVCFLKPVIVKDTFDTVFSIAMHVINYDEILKSQLYSNYLCRLNLYNLVYATTTDTHHLCPPPIQLVIEILSTAQAKDRNAFVRSDCSQYLKAIEKIVHPQKESIYYPINKDDMENALRREEGDQADVIDSEDEKSDAFEESLHYEEDIEEVTEKIDLTEPQNENESPAIEVQSSVQNLSDSEEIIEKISLKSSSEDKSPDIMEVLLDSVEPTISGTQSDTVDAAAEGLQEIQEPANKRRRTTESEQDKEDHTNIEEGVNQQEEEMETTESLDDCNLIATESAETAIEGETEDDIVKKCLADFVDELNEENMLS